MGININILFVVLNRIFLSIVLPILATVILLTGLENDGEGNTNLLESEAGDNPTYHNYLVIVFLVVINLLILIPYLIGGTSILSSVFGFFYWMGNQIINLLHSVTLWMMEFLPEGTPLMLLPAVMLIEVISWMIRPLALVVRICVNMFCSHILLVMSGVLGITLVILCVLLLELGVALVQAYVYSMILML